jgi:hypothetical protein
MKNMFKKILILVVVVFGFSLITLADPPGPPGPGGPPGSGGGIPVGGMIDDGVTILLTLSVAYAVWRFYSLKKDKTNLLS